MTTMTFRPQQNRQPQNNTTVKNLLTTPRYIASALALLLIILTAPAQAQDRVKLQLNSGFAATTQDIGDADVGPGPGIELALSYRVMPHVSVYGGWGWRHFNADVSFAGPDHDFEETGYTYGLQFTHPTSMPRLSYFVQGGGLYNHVEVENAEGDVVGDSGHGLGWQVGAGLEFGLTRNWSVVPTVRYRALYRDVELNATSTDLDLTYVSFGIGFSRTF